MNFIAMVIFIGLMAAGAKIILLAKLGAFRRVLAFDALLDVAVGSVFGFLFYGTMTGMVIAAIATLAFSGFCYCWKQLFGYERLTITGYQPIPPRWRLHVRGREILAGLILAGLLAFTIFH